MLAIEWSDSFSHACSKSGTALHSVCSVTTAIFAKLRLCFIGHTKSSPSTSIELFGRINLCSILRKGNVKADCALVRKIVREASSPEAYLPVASLAPGRLVSLAIAYPNDGKKQGCGVVVAPNPTPTTTPTPDSLP